jgi:hypothetical protein
LSAAPIDFDEDPPAPVAYEICQKPNEHFLYDFEVILSAVFSFDLVSSVDMNLF